MMCCMSFPKIAFIFPISTIAIVLHEHAWLQILVVAFRRFFLLHGLSIFIHLWSIGLLFSTLCELLLIFYQRLLTLDEIGKRYTKQPSKSCGTTVSDHVFSR
jgi:hypothetical protein